MTKLAVVVVLIILFAGCIGWLYNYAALRHYRAVVPPGNFFVVEGRRMHVYCIGAGSPTIVIESGLGDDWIGWQAVQPGLARLTRVCSYDRAGLGWSDPDPGRRDAVAISHQLRELLQRAAITDRLILIGQSAGGLYVRRFAAEYPAEIVGLVLVDSTPPESFDRLPSNRETPEQFKTRHRTARLSRIKDAIGLSRLTGRCEASLPVSLRAYEAYAEAVACRPEYETSWLGEVDDFETSAKEAENTTFGDLPLLIISQDPDRPKPGWPAQDIAANPIWAEMQENLKALSTRSHRIIARGSGHRVQRDRPDVIVSGVGEMISQLRGTSPLPTEYGTTVTR
jgi:pimeloyl-ACP methyl ester carboxylesterase